MSELRHSDHPYPCENLLDIKTHTEDGLIFLMSTTLVQHKF